MVCVAVAAGSPAADVPDEEDSPPPWNSSRAFEPSDPLPTSLPFQAAEHQGRGPACYLLSYAARCPTAFREVSMNVLNGRWLFRVGAGLVGALLAIQLVPYGRDHRNPPLGSEPPWN